MNRPSRSSDWRLFAFLLALGLLGLISLIPYALATSGTETRDLPLPLGVLVVLQLIQGTVLLAAAIGIGMRAGRALGLGAPILKGWLNGERVGSHLKAALPASVGGGILIGLVILFLDSFIFAPQIAALAPGMKTLVWQRLLASLYGGITEELLMRLGLFSAVAWLLSKLFGSGSRLGIFIATNIIVSFFFGLGHLPATAAIMPLTTIVVVRILVLNGLGSLLFGYLYWSKGLEAAMLCHFVADILLAAGSIASL